MKISIGEQMVIIGASVDQGSYYLAQVGPRKVAWVRQSDYKLLRSPVKVDDPNSIDVEEELPMTTIFIPWYEIEDIDGTPWSKKYGRLE